VNQLVSTLPLSVSTREGSPLLLVVQASGENRDQLKSILTYHVVPGELTADRLKDGQEPETVEGESLTVSINGGTVKIDDATVVRPDVDASNGVAHVIDGVLTPSA
jgi:uncharacterized surface protein with fasciclin (FAS1) repeats